MFGSGRWGALHSEIKGASGGPAKLGRQKRTFAVQGTLAARSRHRASKSSMLRFLANQAPR